MALIKCRECGKEISDKSTKCINCGASISKPIFCSECGLEIMPNQTECPNCGNKLKKVVKLSLKQLSIIGTIVVIAVIIIAVSMSSKLDLHDIYDEVSANSAYCEVTSDGSTLIIDTNPNDIDDYFSYTAFQCVKDVNKALGFTDALFTKMGQTRALDGTQFDENDKIEVSWTYHPNKGLYVVYSVK